MYVSPRAVFLYVKSLLACFLQERVKALGYLSANTAATKKTIESLDAELRQDENEVNQLLVQILSCNHVQARQPGSTVFCTLLDDFKHFRAIVISDE